MTDDSGLSDFPVGENVDDVDEAYAERRTAAIAAGRRKGDVAGAAATYSSAAAQVPDDVGYRTKAAALSARSRRAPR